MKSKLYLEVMRLSIHNSDIKEYILHKYFFVTFELNKKAAYYKMSLFRIYNFNFKMELVL